MKKNLINLRHITVIVILFIWVLGFYGVSHSKEKRESMLERKRIKDNKVSIMTRFIYYPLTEVRKKSGITRYDAKGNKIEAMDYDNDGNVIKKTVYKYNEKDLETEYIEYDAVDNITARHENKYDKKDNVIEEIFYGKNNEITYIRNCKYDAQDNMSEYTLLDKNKKNLGVWKYKYDARGNKSEVEVYNATGQYNGKYSYIYSANDEMLEMYTYSKINKIAGRNSFKYDAKNLMSEAIVYNPEGKASSWKRFSYDFSKEAVSASVKPPAGTTETKIAAVSKPEPPKVLQTAEVDAASVATQNSVPAAPVQIVERKDDTVRFHPAFDNDNPPATEKIEMSHFVSLGDRARPDTIMGLMQNGYDVNSQDQFGLTILMSAAASGNKEMAKFLIENGAKADIKDKNGLSAIEYAKYTNNNAILEILKSSK